MFEDAGGVQVYECRLIVRYARELSKYDVHTYCARGGKRYGNNIGRESRNYAQQKSAEYGRRKGAQYGEGYFFGRYLETALFI